MYKDIEEKLAIQRGIPFLGKEEWTCGLPVNMEESDLIV